MTKSTDIMPPGMYGMPSDAAIFEVNTQNMTAYPNGDRLPAIVVTQPFFDVEAGCSGRTHTTVYPYDRQQLARFDDDDEDGDDALYYGGCYYDEAMGYTDPADHGKRVDCFRAAEVLYRHSAGRGNAVANLCLGYVYSYDRCEGRYWADPATSDAKDDQHVYPREERAFACLSIAAEAGIPEACYKLGDLYKHGTGCEANAAEAFRWYARASELATRERPVILGSIALRLGDCYEEGFGCRLEFSRALAWYEKAVEGLEFAVDNGETWYAKALASARAGAKRCRQELG